MGLIHYTPPACYRGYTLFSTTQGGHDAYLIDMNDNVVHRWHSDEGIHYAYLLDNGNPLCRTASPKDAVGIRNYRRLISQRLGAGLERQPGVGLPGRALRHDYERLPIGNTQPLLWERLSEGLAAQAQGGYDE